MAKNRKINNINEIIIDKDQSMIFIEMNDNTKIEVRAYWDKEYKDITIVDVFSVKDEEITEQPFDEDELMEIISKELKSNHLNHELIQND